MDTMQLPKKKKPHKKKSTRRGSVGSRSRTRRGSATSHNSKRSHNLNADILSTKNYERLHTDHNLASHLNHHSHHHHHHDHNHKPHSTNVIHSPIKADNSFDHMMKKKPLDSISELMEKANLEIKHNSNLDINKYN